MTKGVRSIELRAASGSEFDLDNATWEIPAERMKICRPHLVPLSAQALDLLNELMIMPGNYRYVLPGRNDPSKPMDEASINRLIKHLRFGGKVTGYGFRHIVSTILHEQNYNSAWIETQLAHINKNNVRDSYNHENYLSQRKEMMQTYTDMLLNLNEGSL